MIRSNYWYSVAILSKFLYLHLIICLTIAGTYPVISYMSSSITCFDIVLWCWIDWSFPYINLTHWDRMMHIWVGKLTIIGSDNGLSPECRQANIWTNAGILLIGPLGTNFSEILIEIQTFWLKKIRLKMSSAKCCSFRLGLNVLTEVALKRHLVYLRNMFFIEHMTDDDKKLAYFGLGFETNVIFRHVNYRSWYCDQDLWLTGWKVTFISHSVSK